MPKRRQPVAQKRLRTTQPHDWVAQSDRTIGSHNHAAIRFWHPRHWSQHIAPEPVPPERVVASPCARRNSTVDSRLRLLSKGADFSSIDPNGAPADYFNPASTVRCNIQNAAGRRLLDQRNPRAGFVVVQHRRHTLFGRQIQHA